MIPSLQFHLGLTMSNSSLSSLLAGLATITASLAAEQAQPANTSITASINPFKPYKRRKLKTDMFHKLMRSARKYKRPTVQQLYKQRLAKKSWAKRNKTALSTRRMFVSKARKRLGLTASLNLIASRCN